MGSPTLLMSMSEYDLLLRTIHADPSCAPMLADRFQDVGLECHAARLREEGIDWQFAFCNLASMAQHLSAFGVNPDYFHSALYANLATLSDGGATHFYCNRKCYWLVCIDRFENYKIERRS